IDAVKFSPRRIPLVWIRLVQALLNQPRSSLWGESHRQDSTSSDSWSSTDPLSEPPRSPSIFTFRNARPTDGRSGRLSSGRREDMPEALKKRREISGKKGRGFVLAGRRVERFRTPMSL